MGKKIFCLLSFFLLLVSCSPSIATYTKPVAISTISSIPLGFPQSITTSTTPDFRPSPFPRKNPSNTPRPSSTQKPTPTLFPIAKDIKIPTITIDENCGRLGEVPNHQYSPDRKWFYVICEEYPLGYLTMHIYSIDGRYHWEIRDYSGKLPTPQPGEMRTFYRPFLWSKDGNYFYITGGYDIALGDGGCAPPKSGFNLERVNLLTGEISTVIFGTPTKYWQNMVSTDPVYRYYDISPTENHLFVDLNSAVPNLEIIRLRDGQRSVINLPARMKRAGFTFWSPDESKILLSAVSEFEENSINQESATLIYSLLKIEKNTLEVKTVIPDLSQLTPDKVICWGWFNSNWIDNNHILIQFFEIETLWSVDLVTGEVIKQE